MVTSESERLQGITPGLTVRAPRREMGPFVRSTLLYYRMEVFPLFRKDTRRRVRANLEIANKPNVGYLQ